MDRTNEEGTGRVWVAFSGEYEQRGPFAAFTSEGLALQHSDDIEELMVFDRPVRTISHYSRWLTIRGTDVSDEHPPRVSHGWPEWASHSKIIRSETHYYCDRTSDGPKVWVIVAGTDEAAVDAEVERRVSAVLAGDVPQCGCAAHRTPWPTDPAPLRGQRP